MRAIAEPDGAGRTGDFFLRDDMLDIAEPEAAILLLDRDPVQPKLTHLRPQMPREFVRRVNLGSDRLDLVLGETPRRFADRVGHLAEVEIQSGVGHSGVSCSGAPLAEPGAVWKRQLLTQCHGGI